MRANKILERGRDDAECRRKNEPYFSVPTQKLNGGVVCSLKAPIIHTEDAIGQVAERKQKQAL